MTASMPRSTKQLKTKPAAASRPMPAVPASRVRHETLSPSVVAMNMPIMAQKTASSTMRGLVRT